MKNFLKIILIIAIVAAIVGIVFVGIGYGKKITQKVQNPIATIEIENFGTIKIELYPEYAPNTVTNFIALANNGFYDGLTFYKTIPEYFIKSGSKNSESMQLPKLSDIKDVSKDADGEYCIEGEFTANGYRKNTLKMEKGVIAMERNDYGRQDSSLITEGYNSAGSEFFILTNDNENLNGVYAGFGKVIEGLDILDQIANVEVITRDDNAKSGIDVPVNPPVITQIRVETYGVDYKKPDTVEPFNYYNWLIKKYQSNLSQQSNKEN